MRPDTTLRTLQKAAEVALATPSPPPPLPEHPFWSIPQRRRGGEAVGYWGDLGLLTLLSGRKEVFSPPAPTSPTKPSEGGTKKIAQKYSGCLQKGVTAISLPGDNVHVLSGAATKTSRAAI